MTHTNKSGFELRMEILKMSRDMLDSEYAQNQSMAWSMVENIANYHNKSITELQEHIDTVVPKMYTPEDIIKKAKELYTFVTEK